MGVIDLRSDTVTLPSPEMRRAMYEAEVGDDVYGEDRRSTRCKRRPPNCSARRPGSTSPAARWATWWPTWPGAGGGDEVICGEASHTLNAEQANAARVAQTQLRTVPQTGASLDIDAIGRTIRGDDPH